MTRARSQPTWSSSGARVLSVVGHGVGNVGLVGLAEAALVVGQQVERLR